MKIKLSIPHLTLFCLLALFFQQNTFAQVVTFQPSFATQNDSLTIVFDATKGDAGLSGFTGDVYLHSGVITNKSIRPLNTRVFWYYRCY